MVTESHPLIFSADLHPVWLGDIYKSRSAFLICGGPSFNEIDHLQLYRPGVLTMAVNNAVSTFRPNLWICVDKPESFIRSIWFDPAILKFVPIEYTYSEIFDSDSWSWTGVNTSDCPCVFYYRRNAKFDPEQFLWEQTFNWGNSKFLGGGRSVMLPALRMLFTLGVRRVFLLGADFKMDEDHKYHFSQNRDDNAIKGNNLTYKKINKYFKQLRPFFETEGYYVFNCNPESRLDAFDYIEYEHALELVQGEWGNIDVGKERTWGLYDLEKPVSW